MISRVIEGGFKVLPKNQIPPQKITTVVPATVTPVKPTTTARATTTVNTVQARTVLPVATTTVKPVSERTGTTVKSVSSSEPSIVKKVINTFIEADKKVTANIADKLNTTTKTVNTVGLISLIGTGAGLLANGVKSLFDGSLKEKRAIKKAEKAEAKEVKKQAAIATAATAATKAYVGLTGGGQGSPALGSYEQSGTGGMMQKAGPFIQKNWMWIAAAALLLFGGKLLKPKRRAPRRRAAPKTVVRYRTRRTARKAPVRRKR